MKKALVSPLLTVLVMSVLTSACGNKSATSNSGKRATPASAPQQPPAPGNSGTGDGAKQSDEDKRTPPQTAPGRSKRPSLPGSEPRDGKGQKTPDDKNGQSQKDPDQNSDEEDDSSADNENDQQTQKPKAPDQSDSQAETEVDMSKSKYTTASNDYLYGDLTQRMNAVQDAKQSQRNKELAGKVRRVFHQVDITNTNKIVVMLFVDIEIKGVIQTFKYESELNQAGVGTLYLPSTRLERGSIMCLDRNTSTCHSAMIRIILKDNKTGLAAVARAISRKTSANFDFKMPAQTGHNAEFERLAQMFLNTEKKNGAINSLRRVLVESFEVIGGGSGMKISMVTNEDQAIVGSGPLLIPASGGISTNVTLDRDAHLTDLMAYDRGSGFKLDFHNSIEEMRLIGNDGSKELTLALKVRAGLNSNEQTLRVTFIRQHLGILSSFQVHDLEKQLNIADKF